MSHDPELTDFKVALAADPTNLDLAWDYWHALGCWNGCDVRAGMYVLQLFRPAALKSPAGVLAFARAYRELFELSGEGPRQLDPELIECAQSALETLASPERGEVQWLLESVGHVRPGRISR